MRFSAGVCFIASLFYVFAQSKQEEYQTQQHNHFVVNAESPQNSDLNNQQKEAIPPQNLNQVLNEQVPQQQPQPNIVQVQQLNGVPPVQQQQFSIPPIQQQPVGVPPPPQAVTQQHQSNVPTVQQQPLVQQLNEVPPPQQVKQQPEVMQQQFSVPPIQQPIQPNVVPLQQVDGVPQPQVVPQQPPVTSMPSVNPREQPVQQHKLQAPAHGHIEGTPRGYDHHVHDSLPPKPRQKKYEPPSIINNDNELDFYSRLPSPLSLDPEVDGSMASLRPFLALTVNVTPGVKDCYFYEAPMSFVVDVQVIGSDGGMDIGLAVFDPSGLAIVRRDPTGETSLTISVQPQFQKRAYAICLDNRKASYGRKKVYLGIELHIDWHNPSSIEKEVIERMKTHLRTADSSKGLLSMFDNFDRVTDSLDRISGLLHRSQRLQQRTRNNLAADRAMMQANKDRVTSWSTFQALVLVFVGIFQTLLIRSLFDTNSSLHRLWIRGGRDSRSVPTYNVGLRY